MRTFIGVVPLSVLALAVSIVVALALSARVARWLRVHRWLAALLLFGFGFVISATLVPTAAALEGQASDGVCDMSRIGLAPIRELTTVNFTSLNVLLFMPLGLATGLLPRNRRTTAVTLAAISLTFVIETLQLLLPALGRGCQTADMSDNLLGLGIGIAVGLLARTVIERGPGR